MNFLWNEFFSLNWTYNSLNFLLLLRYLLFHHVIHSFTDVAKCAGSLNTKDYRYYHHHNRSDSNSSGTIATNTDCSTSPMRPSACVLLPVTTVNRHSRLNPYNDTTSSIIKSNGKTGKCQFIYKISLSESRLLILFHSAILLLLIQLMLHIQFIYL